MMPVTNTSAHGSIELAGENAPMSELAYYRDMPPTISWPYTANSGESIYRFQPVAINPTFLHLAQQEAFARAFFGFYSHRSIYDGLKASNYTAPANDDEKPKQSYVRLIGEAILNSPEKKLVLSEIYKTIQTKYTYFRNRGSGWKNSIRHNLSLNDCFVKLGRSTNGKGHYWTVSPPHYEDFLRGSSHQRKLQKKQPPRLCYYPKEAFYYGNHFIPDTPTAQMVFEQRDDYEKPTEPEVKQESGICSVNKRTDTECLPQHRPFDVENLLAVHSKRPVSY